MGGAGPPAAAPHRARTAPENADGPGAVPGPSEAFANERAGYFMISSSEAVLPGYRPSGSKWMPPALARSVPFWAL